MSRKLSILAFAYVFPPDAGSGTYRTLYFSNNWARQGDNVTIITVRKECFLSNALIDHDLCKEVDPSIRIFRASAKRPLQKLLAMKTVFRQKTSAFEDTFFKKRDFVQKSSARTHNIFRLIKDAITDILSCPDEHIGWVPSAVLKGYRITKKSRVDCIYATGGPWSCFLAGLCLHKLSGIPLATDFRDPWISNPNLSFKSSFSRYIQNKMESICINASNVVITNTEELRQDFITRYPYIDPSLFITVTNGFENICRGTDSSTQQFNLVHTGALYQSRNPTNFLRAVIELVRDRTIPKKRFRVQLVGGVSIDDPTLKSVLRSEVLQDVLEVIPRVSHDDALLLQQHASALVIIQTGFPLQVPRKLYEYLSMVRPILAIAEHNSATAKLVNELNAGYVVENNINSIKIAIVELYKNWQLGRTRNLNEEALSMYSNQYLSSKLRDIMLELLSPS